MNELELRTERPGDEATIARTVAAAFGTEAEADLVAGLRGGGGLCLSLVALRGDEILGHIALSPVEVAGLPGGDRWLGLGPLAVVPASQRQGIGMALVRRALDVARDRGAAAVFVLGDPDYYDRLGFEMAGPLGWRCKYDVPAAAFRVRRLGGQGCMPPSGMVRYHAVFDSI